MQLDKWCLKKYYSKLKHTQKVNSVVKHLPITTHHDFFLKGVKKFVNGYMGGSLLKGVTKFVRANLDNALGNLD